MEQEILLSVLTAITSALGVKEIWQLWKKRMELNEEKANKDARAKDKLMSEVIVDLKHKIEELESKIEILFITSFSIDNSSEFGILNFRFGRIKSLK